MELANLIGSTEALMFRRQSTSGGILGPALDRLLRKGD